MKVLIVDFNFLGDMIMDSVAFKAVHKKFGVKADALIWDVSREPLLSNPHVGNIYTVGRSYFWQLVIAWALRGKYDVVIHLNTSLKVNLLVFLIGGRTVGYDYRHRGFLLKVRIPKEFRTYRGKYRPDEVCDLLESAFGWEVKDRGMVFIP
jgi:ADP-heptose:LPS heptosyltransferase